MTVRRYFQILASSRLNLASARTPFQHPQVFKTLQILQCITGPLHCFATIGVGKHQYRPNPSLVVLSYQTALRDIRVCLQLPISERI